MLKDSSQANVCDLDGPLELTEELHLEGNLGFIYGFAFAHLQAEGEGPSFQLSSLLGLLILKRTQPFLSVCLAVQRATASHLDVLLVSLREHNVQHIATQTHQHLG